MGTRFPLRHAQANVIFGREGGRYALYRLGTVSYLFMSEPEKEAVLSRLARFALAVRSDFSLYRVTRAYPAERYAEQAEMLLDTRYANSQEWDLYLEGHIARLRELRSTIPEVYLAVSLRPPRPSQMGAALYWKLEAARRRVEALVGVESGAPIARSELQALAESEQRLFERLQNVFPPGAPIERASTSELQWLLRRASCRGIAEPKLDGQWKPRAQRLDQDDNGNLASYHPLENTLFQTANSPITENDRHLVIEAPEGDSYQSMLTFGALPEDPEFPGPNAELLFAPLEAVDFPVDAVLHATWQGNREALSRARKGVVDAENVFRDAMEGSDTGADYHSEENRALARELEAYLKSDSRPPMLHARMSLAVGADSARALEQRVDALEEQYGDVALWKPKGLQQSLWYDHLLRTDGGLVSDYTEPLTIDQFGALMPTGTHHAGSVRGLYIGYTPRGKRPIKYAPEEAAQNHRLTGVLASGTPGSGKTNFAELIAYQAARAGHLVVDVDPKPDHNYEGIPDLAGQVDIIEISGDERYRGMLDPLRVSIESMREEVATAYFVQALQDPTPTQEQVIQRAVRDEVRAGGTSSLNVIRRLHEMSKTAEYPAMGEAAAVSADGLELIADSGLGRLAFSEGGSDEVTARTQLTTIRMPNVELPDPDVPRADYSRSDHVAVAALTLINSFALRLIASDSSRHKVVVFDEAWHLLASAQGKSLLNRLLREGRARNATVVLATQRLADLGELSNLIGTYFMFGQESAAEARQALEIVGLDPNDSALVATVRDWANNRDIHGRCFMRDIDGRVAEAQIDLVYEELLQAFDTSPAARESSRSPRPAPDPVEAT